MSAGRIVLLVFGIIVLVISLGLLAVGGGVLWANSALTDNEGYYTTGTLKMEKGSHAIVTQPAEIDLGSEWVWDFSKLVTFKVEGWSDDASKGIFIGVGSESDVKDYLTGVEYDEITNFRINPDRLEYRHLAGSSQPAAPTTQTFWTESAYGSGTQTLRWDLESGSWVLVLMNEDGSADVDLRVVLGAKVPWLFRTGVGFLVGGIVAVILGILMVVLATRRA